jgi:gumN protein
MNKLLSLLAVCLAIVPLSACKQEVSEKPAAKQEKAASVVIRPELNWDTPKLTSNVWKISKAGQPDSYLVGTIHIGKPNATLSQDAKNLLASAEQLVTEADMLPQLNDEEIAKYQEFMQKIYSQDSLKSKLGDKNFELLQQDFMKSPELAQMAPYIDHMHPWAVLLFALSIYPPGYSNHTGVDILLSKAAQESGKKRLALEDVTDISQMFASQPEKLMIKMLMTVNEYNDQEIKHLFDLYEKGNFAELPLAEAEFEQEFAQKYPDAIPVLSWERSDLLIKRNQIWLPKIKEISAKKKTVFAVGIMHLMSEQGLIEKLRKDGYQVTPEPSILMW